jgi:hypothetical protein
LSRVDEHLIGSKGSVICGTGTMRDRKGGIVFQHDSKNDPNPYQVEHDELFAAIAKGEYKYADAENGANATMTSILGRMATYSGQVVEWDKAINSGINIMPKTFEWDANPPLMPDANGMYPCAVPGVTKYFT